MSHTRVIAIAIGYHFWKSCSDEEAYRNGIDAAREVVKAILKHESEIQAEAYKLLDELTIQSGTSGK